MTAAPGPVCLRSGPLTLRPWAEPDASDVLAALREAEIALWNGASVEDLAAAREWVSTRADWSDGSHASFAITATQGGGVLGSVSLHRIDWAQGDAEIGYWTAPGARRTGAAGRAVAMVCRWSFAVLPVDRIQLFHAVQNVGSAGVARRAGFTLEGRLRQSYRYGDGLRRDELLWSRLRGDPEPITG